MMNYRMPSRVMILLIVFSMLAQMCAATTAGAAARAKSPAAAHRAKVSHALRDRLRRAGESVQTAEVILQLSGKPSGRLNALLNRAGVHVRAKLDRLDTLALALPPGGLHNIGPLGE